MGVGKLLLHRGEAVAQRVGTATLGGDGSLSPVSQGYSVRQQGHGLIGECDRGSAVGVGGISVP
jgi:hypothetical protein